MTIPGKRQNLLNMTQQVGAVKIICLFFFNNNYNGLIVRPQTSNIIFYRQYLRILIAQLHEKTKNNIYTIVLK